MIHPDDTFDFTFVEARDAPSPRTFTYKHGTALYWLQFSRKFNAILASRSADHETSLAAMIELASERLTGMANVNGAATIDGVLMQWELERLCRTLPYTAAGDEVMKKKREFPWLFDTGDSARGVDPAGAGTPPAPSSPPISSA